MSIYVWESAPAGIALAGICYASEGRMWVDEDDPWALPMECYCAETAGGPDACIGPVYRLERPGILIYETEDGERTRPPAWALIR